MKSLLDAAEPGPDAELAWSRGALHEQSLVDAGSPLVSRLLRHVPLAVVVTAAIAVLVASCGNGSEGTSPEEVPGGRRGDALYQSNCASCHGADLRGTEQGPSHLSIVYEPNHHGDDAFRSAIVNGVRQHHWDFGDMAPITGLDDEQIDDIIAFVRSEQEQQGFDR